MKRPQINPYSIALPLISIFLALAVGAIIIAIQGTNPMHAYYYLIRGAFGNRGAIGETIIKTIPLIFTGLAFMFAFRSGVVNIGAEGQLLMGGIGFIWSALTFSFLPGPLLTLVSLVFGGLFGLIWGAIPGWLKAKKGINEIINTILLNYIALHLVSYVITGPLQEAAAQNPQTDPIKDSARMLRIVPGTRIHLGIILGIIAAIAVYYYLFHTAHGYQMRAVGLNRQAAEYGGINVQRKMVLALALSGMLAGLGGAIELAGVQYRLMDGFGRGYGFDGMAVALIGQLHPIGTLFAAYFFGVLRTGANTMQRTIGIPTSVVDIIQALVIFFVLGFQTIRDPERFLRFFRNRKNALTREQEGDDGE